MHQPIIGITSDHHSHIDGRGSHQQTYQLNSDYCRAVEIGGGIPLILPYVHDELASNIVKMIHGLVISGGDFDHPPEFFGRSRSQKLGKLKPERSNFELSVLRLAREVQMPVLGICGGMQLINIEFGGTLYQDVSERRGTSEHTQPTPKSEVFHCVKLKEDSVLRRVFRQSIIGVNSTHHQLVERVGQGLMASGIAPDGVIEGIEATEEPFTVGLQWHPEALGEEHSLAVFGSLIDAAKYYQESRG
ncbi:MAG: gamma-glutamyl-gamma-aminobutyrate hydrolase family protein [Myxococcota bacterium]|nr:gamma-glutamyl-gamma-aminobutyrate hydrolase family protein [Myxococcota bacterium]